MADGISPKQNLVGYMPNSTVYETTTLDVSSTGNTSHDDIYAYFNHTVTSVINAGLLNVTSHAEALHTTTPDDSVGGTLNQSYVLTNLSVASTLHPHWKSRAARTFVPQHSSTTRTTTFTLDIEDHHYMPLFDYWKIVALTCASLLLVCILVLIYFFIRRRAYSKVEEPETCPPYEYVYKPSQGGYIEEEYENTFVGVSIPLLQEVTKV